MKKLNSENVIKFRDFFDEKFDLYSFAVIITEFCPVNNILLFILLL